ncbi:hypothetical protein QE152_g28308 [Popillia japonica]|uniref:Reverse transcriptase n=1 Tax=Popillia japonica TaxID=7064 RepID=A0AAW1JJY0_POPJA
MEDFPTIIPKLSRIFHDLYYELVHQFSTTALATLTKEPEGRDWDRQIGRLQYGINNTYHNTIKTTPFRLLMNYEPRNYDGNPLEDETRERRDADGNPLEDETRERRDAIDIATKRVDAMAIRWRMKPVNEEML